MTNAYADVQDLYVETVDPDNSDNYLEGVKTDNVLTLRWAAAETMQPEIALRDLLTAETVEDVHEIVSGFSMSIFNFVFADTQGSIGWRVAGKIPIRARGDGTLPSVVEDTQDDWVGWIPIEKMPHMTDPQRGWLDTCNHKTVNSDYPYYYSSYFAPSYRYRRLGQLMDVPGEKTVDDHWKFQRDTKNLMAEEIAPIMTTALLAHTDTQQMGRILHDWDFVDDSESPAPAIFQTTYRKFAEMVFRDELGPELTQTMLDSRYFWEERLQRSSTRSRPGVEAGNWGVATGVAWGKVHKIEFVNPLRPLRRTGWGKSLLGGRSYPMSGSGETLYRGWYDFHNPAWVTHSASLRMVVDLNDPDKIQAVLAGGVTGPKIDDSHSETAPW